MEKEEQTPQDKVQEVMKESTKNATTTKDVLKETLTLDQIRLPVLARVKKRVAEIQKLSRAHTQKVPLGLGGYNHFITVAPKMFISGLDARFDGSKGAIVYMTYKTQKNKDTGEVEKVMNVNSKVDVPGIGKMEVNGAYVLDKLYIETFEYGKSIQRQEIKPQEIGIQ